MTEVCRGIYSGDLPLRKTSAIRRLRLNSHRILCETDIIKSDREFKFSIAFLYYFVFISISPVVV